MSWNDHDHHGDYAEAGHDHYDYAERHHRHYDDESTVQGLRQDLSQAEERIRELEDGLRDALNRIHVLEDRQPDYVASEPAGEPSEDTRRLSQIRDLLAAFDWERDDRQYALEAIEMIAEGGQP